MLMSIGVISEVDEILILKDETLLKWPLSSLVWLMLRTLDLHSRIGYNLQICIEGYREVDEQ